jgi:hypothetical protein
MILLDDTTSTQLLLLDAERPFNTPPPNNVAHVARILARSATACSVSLFLLFLTVSCEFFTEGSAADSLPAIALKSNVAETTIESQLAVSTALAVFFMLMLLLLGSNQQLNGVFLRLQYMTQSVPLDPQQAAAYPTRADDLALFVRVLLCLFVTICGTTGTFQEILFLNSIDNFKTAIGGEKRNYVALPFILWCCVTDAFRALSPSDDWDPVFIIAVTLIDLVQVFISVILAIVLFRDTSLTNFACAVLVICDASCVMYASVGRIFEKVLTSVGEVFHSADPLKQAVPQPVRVPTTLPGMPSQPEPQKLDLHKAMASGAGLCFSEANFNVENIKMRVFEKKSN